MAMKNTLVEKLEVFIRKYYTNRLIKGLIYGIGLSLAYFFIMTLAEYFGRFGSQTRLILLILLLAGLGLIIGYYILYPVSKLLKLGKRISYDRAARIIGKHFPDVDDKILNTLQLQKLSTAESDLLKASIDQRISTLSPVPFSRAIDFKENSKYWPILVVPILVFAVVFLSGKWDMVSDSSRRIAAFNKEFLPEAPFQFVLLNEDLTVEQGGDITLELLFNGASIPGEATLVLPSGESRMTKGGMGEYTFNLSNLQESTEFKFQAAGFSSRTYKLDVLPVPQINSFSLQVTPPAYTQIEPYQSEAKLVQDVPEGSTVRWLLNLRQGNNAFLVLDTGENKFTDQGSGNFEFTQRALGSFDYAVRTDNDRVSKTNLAGNRINVIKDAYPAIEVEYLVDSANPNVVYYSGRVADDYGFSGLRVVIRQGGDKTVNAEGIKRSVLSQSIGGVLNLDSLSGEKGGDIRISLEVLDNDGVNGAKTTRSKEYTLKLLGSAEKKQEISKNYDRFFKNSEDFKQEIEDIQKALEKLRKQMMDKRSLSFSEKSKLKELLNKQKELLVKQAMNEQLLQETQLKEEKLKPKQEDIKKKEDEIDKIKTEEEKKAEELMKEIEKLMQKLDMQKLSEKLDQLQKMNEQNQKAIERKDDLLKDLLFQKDLLEQAEKLQQLGEEMKELSEKNDEKSSEEPKGDDKKSELEEQDEVNEEFEKVKEKVEELRKENKAFDMESEKQKTEQKAQEASDQMKQAKESLQKEQSDKANESQDKAGQKMQEMSESLQQSMMSMQAQANKVNIETLRQILENLEVLSFDIEDLSDRSKGIERDDPDFKTLLTEQRRLQEGARVIEDSLTALAKKVPQIQQAVFDELELIRDNLVNGIDNLEELRNGQAAAHQQYVMTSANNLALMLEQSLRQMQQMMAQSKPGSQQCEKPGSKPGSKPGMAQMRKMQQGLGEKMDRMMKGSKKGEGEGNEDGSRGMGGKEMVEILSEQEQLRQALEKLSEEEGQSGSKGNLQKAIDQMKELERDMIDMNLSSDYKERLKEIESRLLESEKAEKEQKKDERREAESGDDLRQMYQKELQKYLEDKGKEDESIDRLPLDFRNYYKDQTFKYLNNL